MYKVLIVDDNHVVLTALMKAFMRSVFNIITAQNGKEAIDAVTVHKPDIVIMDIDMPVMNGFDACRMITEAHPGMPIIFMSGRYISKESVLKNGAVDCAQKPLNLHAIVERAIYHINAHTNNSQISLSKIQIIGC